MIALLITTFNGTVPEKKFNCWLVSLTSLVGMYSLGEEHHTNRKIEKSKYFIY